VLSQSLARRDQIAMSALPPIADIRWHDLNVRLGPKAEVTPLDCDVRFTPNSGHSPTRSGCLLWANNGHFLGPSRNTAKYVRDRGVER
jgi:hypothetical protein